MGVPEMDPLSQLCLPPGFRFYPTDEELMVKYLCPKAAGHDSSLEIIGEIDLYKFDPWVLPCKAKFGEKEWYFFSPRDRKYPNGSRPNRVAGSGYWKATGTDKMITSEGRKVGIKKSLVFYVGKAPKGTKTNWIMHEYRLLESPNKKSRSSKLDDWVLCRIYEKNSSGQRQSLGVSSKDHSHCSPSSSSSQYDDMLDTIPESDNRFLINFPRLDSQSVGKSQLEEKINFNLHRLPSGNFDWATLARLTSSPEIPPVGQSPAVPSRGAVNGDFQNLVDTSIRHVGSEIRSGPKTQASGSDFLMQNPGSYSQCYRNSFDPFTVSYPTQTGNLKFTY